MTAFCLFLPSSTAVFAASTPTVTLPVEISLSGDAPADAQEYTIVLSAVTPSAPMPDGAQDGVYRLTLTGPGTAAFPSVSYAQTGTYLYSVAQLPGSDSSCSYDQTAYTLTVTVSDVEGVGLEAVAVLTLSSDQQGTKQDAVRFVNAYPTISEPPVDPTSPTATDVPQTGDGAWWGWGALCVLSLSALALLAKKRRR